MQDEERFISIGASNINRILLIVHTEIEANENEILIRIISCQKPTAAEKIFMNKDKDEMRAEYDFSKMKGVRGKYYQAYRQGHTVKIRHEDGAVVVHKYTLEDGAIMLDSDVKQYFPDSESVNKALRNLIELVPDKPTKREGI